MRRTLTVVFTLLSVIGMIVAVPAVWATANIVSEDGFASAARSAAGKPEVQRYFADQIADQVAADTGLDVAGTVVRPLATAYTQSPAFVPGFTDIARQQHRWLFEAPAPGTSPHQMDLDLTPMVNAVLASSPVPITVQQKIVLPVDQAELTAGSMEATGRQLTVIGWLSAIGAVVLGLLAVVAGRNRFGVIAWLGLGAVLAGIVGALTTAFLERQALGTAAADAGADATMHAVASEVLRGLATTSIIVGGIGAGVAVLGALPAFFFRR